MYEIESITTYLRRRLRETGSANFEEVSKATGVAKSFLEKFHYGVRTNPRVGTIQPLLVYFGEIDRGVRDQPGRSRG